MAFQDWLGQEISNEKWLHLSNAILIADNPHDIHMVPAGTESLQSAKPSPSAKI